MSRTIQLTEWGETQEAELSFDQIDSLRRVAGRAVEITPGSRRDTWNLRATSYAGAIRVGDLAVFIQPKIPLENLFYMLSAGQTDLDFGTSLIGYEEDRLLSALAVFYERLVGDTLKRGVLKAYRQHEETLVALRGRIDVPAVIRSGGMPAPIPCRFDELSIDVPENRVLRTAALVLTNYPDVAPSVRRDLRRSVGVLDGVKLVDPRAVPTIHWSRLNRYYEPALRMAEVILRAGGLRDRVGGSQASTFLIDMNRLFERFVTIQLRRHLLGRLEVRDQEQIHLDIRHKVPMRPDLVLYHRGIPVLVADIKYKLTEDGLARNADYYQLHAYCQTLGLGKGALIYASEEGVQSTSILVVDDGPLLSVEPVDLGGSRDRVDRGMGNLALALSGRAVRSGFAGKPTGSH